MALSSYKGDLKPDLVTAIELAEHYAGGGEVVRLHARVVVSNASRAAADDISGASANAVYAATYAARTVVNACESSQAAAHRTTSRSEFAAHYAERSGAGTHEIRAAYARWVVRDLGEGRALPAERRQAAGAAVVAGDEDLARRLVQGKP